MWISKKKLQMLEKRIVALEKETQELRMDVEFMLSWYFTERKLALDEARDLISSKVLEKSLNQSR